MISRAKSRFIRGSAQKARLVIDQIRGCRVEEAFAILKFSPKRAAHTIEECLKSAVANAQQKDSMVDVDDLRISKAVIEGGPIMKRIRPAPMGRAFRILKRFHHVTIEISNEG
ncbi:MAG: 50S ribosomal protein L22 [Acidobacteria bacterium]|nr:50S ribosomal protein L22 [Acidobacteriota bacterium]